MRFLFGRKEEKSLDEEKPEFPQFVLGVPEACSGGVKISSHTIPLYT